MLEVKQSDCWHVCKGSVMVRTQSKTVKQYGIYISLVFWYSVMQHYRTSGNIRLQGYLQAGRGQIVCFLSNDFPGWFYGSTTPLCTHMHLCVHHGLVKIRLDLSQSATELFSFSSLLGSA